MGRTVSIEPITRRNALVFKNVRLRALQDAPTAFGSTYAQAVRLADDDWRRRADEWNGERSASFLAMDAASPCGMVGCFLDREDSARAHLVAMWVAPAHRRAGVGRELVGAVLDWARGHGVDDVRLTVTSSNDAAIGFYRRLGFAFTGGTEPYPNDPGLIEREMIRPLRAPPHADREAP